jgi:putative oxidoreductase
MLGGYRLTRSPPALCTVYHHCGRPPADRKRGASAGYQGRKIAESANTLQDCQPSSLPEVQSLTRNRTMNSRYLPFVGRVLIGLPFAMSGLSKLAAYGPTTAMISAVGLPIPPLAFAVAVAVELGGGVLLILGYHVRPVALALAVFSLATAISFHSNFADQNQMIHFLKNVMMAGGLLQITAFGAGAISIEQWRRKSGLPSAATG